MEIDKNLRESKKVKKCLICRNLLTHYLYCGCRTLCFILHFCELACSRMLIHSHIKECALYPLLIMYSIHISYGIF